MIPPLNPPRGTHDIFMQDAQKFQIIEEKILQLSLIYGYPEIRTPIFENISTFERSLGQTSDIIHKEMYVFQDRSQSSLVLRPEGTAPVMRAFLNSPYRQNLPFKALYRGPMFRYERPQKGRNRQFHQIGVESIGAMHFSNDIEIISFAYQFLKELLVEAPFILEINSLGTVHNQASYRQTLITYFKDYGNDLSADSQRRLTTNPLRILDSKAPEDQKIIQQAPKIEKSLDTASWDYFQEILASLTNLNIPFILNPTLVRGLDYYCHTVFEFTTPDLGTQNAILSGGRYDNLSTQFGHPPLQSIGWAAGIERLALLMNQALPSNPSNYLIALGERALHYAVPLLFQIRQNHIPCDMGIASSLKKNLSKASSLHAPYAIIFGEKELNDNIVEIKNLKTQTQDRVDLTQIIPYLKSKKHGISSNEKKC